MAKTDKTWIVGIMMTVGLHSEPKMLDVWNIVEKSKTKGMKDLDHKWSTTVKAEDEIKALHIAQQEYAISQAKKPKPEESSKAA